MTSGRNMGDGRPNRGKHVRTEADLYKVKVCGVASFPMKIDDFPGDRANPKEDKRQSSDRAESIGEDGCNKAVRAKATVEGDPTTLQNYQLDYQPDYLLRADSCSIISLIISRIVRTEVSA